MSTLRMRSRWHLAIRSALLILVPLFCGSASFADPCEEDSLAVDTARLSPTVVQLMQRLSNDDVDWELTPSLDLTAVLDEDALALLTNADREQSVYACIAMLKKESQFIVAHVILCHLMGCMDPSVEVKGGRIHAYVRGLRVEIQYPRAEGGGKRVTYPSMTMQRSAVMSQWSLLSAKPDAYLRHLARSEQPDADDRDAIGPPRGQAIEKLVRESLAEGPQWDFRSFRAPGPRYSASLVELLQRNRDEAVKPCLELLMTDEHWTNAHLLLAQLLATEARRHTLGRGDGYEMIIDGLTIEATFVRPENTWTVSYPRRELEKHLVRHRWLVRTGAY